MKRILVLLWLGLAPLTPAAAQTTPEAAGITPERMACIEAHHLHMKADGAVAPEAVIAACEPLAEAGWLAAQEALGVVLYKRSRDDPRAARLFREAALQGARGAQFHHGLNLVGSNPADAYYWLERSAKQGNTFAMPMLAAGMRSAGRERPEETLFWYLVAERYGVPPLPRPAEMAEQARAVLGAGVDAVAARADAFRPAIEAVDPASDELWIYLVHQEMSGGLLPLVRSFLLPSRHITDRITAEEAAWVEALRRRPAVRAMFD